MRLGDPISSYLFIIAIELLALNIQQNLCIRSIKFSNNIIKVCQYADDITLFLSGKDSIVAVFSLMKVLANCSDLKINVNKTQIMAVEV